MARKKPSSILAVFLLLILVFVARTILNRSTQSKEAKEIDQATEQIKQDLCKINPAECR